MTDPLTPEAVDRVAAIRAAEDGKNFETAAPWMREKYREKARLYLRAADADLAGAAVDRLASALRQIDMLLTTAEGDDVPRGETPKLAARSIARSTLDRLMRGQ